MCVKRLTMILCIIFAGRVQAQAGRHLEISLVTDAGSISPGGELRVGLLMRIEANWHTYWRNPGDAGMAPVIHWHLPEGFELLSVNWPVPERIIEPGELSVNAYRDSVLIMVRIRAPENFERESLHFGVDATWLSCHRVCVQEQGQADLSFPLDDREAFRPELFEYFGLRLPERPDRYSGVKITADWLPELEMQHSVRVGRVTLNLSGSAFSLMPEGEVRYDWFDYPSDYFETEIKAVRIVDSGSGGMTIDIPVRSLLGEGYWPFRWSGILCVELLHEGSPQNKYFVVDISG